MPTHFPLSLNAGPPEFPEFIAASICKSNHKQEYSAHDAKLLSQTKIGISEKTLRRQINSI